MQEALRQAQDAGREEHDSRELFLKKQFDSIGKVQTVAVKCTAQNTVAVAVKCAELQRPLL